MLRAPRVGRIMRDILVEPLEVHMSFCAYGLSANDTGVRSDDLSDLSLVGATRTDRAAR